MCVYLCCLLCRPSSPPPPLLRKSLNPINSDANRKPRCLLPSAFAAVMAQYKYWSFTRVLIPIDLNCTVVPRANVNRCIKRNLPQPPLYGASSRLQFSLSSLYPPVMYPYLGVSLLYLRAYFYVPICARISYK